MVFKSADEQKTPRPVFSPPNPIKKQAEMAK
jgi:hypothetical protein